MLKSVTSVRIERFLNLLRLEMQLLRAVTLVECAKYVVMGGCSIVGENVVIEVRLSPELGHHGLAISRSNHDQPWLETFHGSCLQSPDTSKLINDSTFQCLRFPQKCPRCAKYIPTLPVSTKPEIKP